MLLQFESHKILESHFIIHSDLVCSNGRALNFWSVLSLNDLIFCGPSLGLPSSAVILWSHNNPNHRGILAEDAWILFCVNLFLFCQGTATPRDITKRVPIIYTESETANYHLSIFSIYFILSPKFMSSAQSGLLFVIPVMIGYLGNDSYQAMTPKA